MLPVGSQVWYLHNFTLRMSSVFLILLGTWVCLLLPGNELARALDTVAVLPISGYS